MKFVSLNSTTLISSPSSNPWELAALGEGLEHKGVLIRQELFDAITELRQRHPEATTLEGPLHHRDNPQSQVFLIKRGFPY